MTAFAFDFMKLWTQSDAESERLLVKMLLPLLDRRVQADSDLLSRIKVGKELAGPVFYWIEEENYPSHITGSLSTATITFSGNLFGKAINAQSCNSVIRVGTILERESDGMQCRVSAVTFTDPATFTATVAAHGASVLGDDASGPTTYRIISEGWTDYREIDKARSLDRKTRSVGTQIHAETFEIPKTRKNTSYEIVTDEVEHQIAALIDKMRRQLAYAVVRQQPAYSAGSPVYGNAAEESFMCGIFHWPVITQAEAANTNVYVNASGAELTKSMMDKLIRHLMIDEYANYGSGNWVLACHPALHEYISLMNVGIARTDPADTTVGERILTFDSKIGKSFKIVADQYMRPDVLGLLNLDKLSYGYFKNDRLDRKEIATQGRFQRWLISYQTYGVVARDPRANIGMIYNLAYAS